MSDEMGTFRVDVEIENPAHLGEKRIVRSALVDTGAELSWFPRDVLQSLGIEPVKVWHFRQADGTVLGRWTGGSRCSWRASGRWMKWYSASPVTSCCWAPARWKA